MTDPTRRTLLAGVALGAAAASFAADTPAGADVPPVGKPAPGFYRYKLGSFEVTVVTDGIRLGPLPENFVRNASRDDLNAALADAFLPKDRFPNVFTPVVVNTGSRLIAFDTGNGPGAFAQSNGTVGQFRDNLGASGIDPAAITTVVISHFHGDHISGLVDADSKPAFANAEVLVPAAEWAFWMDDGQMSRAPDGLKATFANVRRIFNALGTERVAHYEADREIVPGVTALATYGHTPGHTSHLVSSAGDSLLVQADVSIAPYFFVRNPGWHVMFDMDPVQAEETRRRLYDRVVAERLRLQGYHFPFPATGWLAKEGAGYRLVPMFWSPVL